MWQKAINLAEKNKKWIPGLTIIKTQVLDNKGQVKEENETWIKAFLNQDGEIKMEMQKVFENDKNISDEQKEENDKKKEKRNKKENKK